MHTIQSTYTKQTDRVRTQAQNTDTYETRDKATKLKTKPKDSLDLLRDATHDPRMCVYSTVYCLCLSCLWPRLCPSNLVLPAGTLISPIGMAPAVSACRANPTGRFAHFLRIVLPRGSVLQSTVQCKIHTH